MKNVRIELWVAVRKQMIKGSLATAPLWETLGWTKLVIKPLTNSRRKGSMRRHSPHVALIPIFRNLLPSFAVFRSLLQSIAFFRSLSPSFAAFGIFWICWEFLMKLLCACSAYTPTTNIPSTSPSKAFNGVVTAARKFKHYFIIALCSLFFNFSGKGL